MFSDDAVTMLQVQKSVFFHTNMMAFRTFDTKFVFYGPSNPLAPMKHWFVFEEDEKAARVYKWIKTKQN